MGEWLFGWEEFGEVKMELYRIMSFFELYELLTNKRLKMTKLKLMEDLNEGFAYSLNDLLPRTFNPVFFTSSNMNKETYNLVRESKFITCWTKEKESMAMWLLYSKDFKSIRIKTSKEKLKKVIDNYIDEIMYPKHLYSESRTLMSNMPTMIGDVRYVDFKDYKTKILEFKKEFDFELNNLKEKTDENYISLISKFFDKSEKLLPLKDILFLKNKAYSHENEVRAGISLVFRNDINNEEVKSRLKRDDESMSNLLGTFIFREFNPNDFENVYYIDLKIDDFIEEICFDPRIPTYQKDIYTDILGLKDDKRVVTSDIFGSYVELYNKL